MKKIFYLYLLFPFVFSCDTKNNTEVVIVKPVDSFVINNKNVYELVNMDFINDNSDTIFTLDAENPKIRLYSKNENKVYDQFKEIELISTDSINLLFCSFSRISNNEYLLLTYHNNIFIRFDSTFNPIDTFQLNISLHAYKSNELSIENINYERIIKVNDSTLFFKVVSNKEVFPKNLNPFVLYDLKNNAIIKNNIKWYWSDIVLRSKDFLNAPYFYRMNEHEIIIGQPHSDSLVVFNTTSNNSKTIVLNNHFYNEPDKGLFQDPKNNLVDIEKYHTTSFINQMLFGYESKVFMFFTKPSDNLLAYEVSYIHGLDINNNNTKYFELPYKYTLKPTSYISNNKIILHKFSENKSLNDIQEPSIFHIYNFNDFNF